MPTPKALAPKTMSKLKAYLSNYWGYVLGQKGEVASYIKKGSLKLR